MSFLRKCCLLAVSTADTVVRFFVVACFNKNREEHILYYFFFFSLSEVLKDSLHLFLHADNSQEMNISMSEDEMTSEYILFVVAVAVKLMMNPHDPVVGARTNGEERHFIPSQ